MNYTAELKNSAIKSRHYIERSDMYLAQDDKIRIIKSNAFQKLGKKYFGIVGSGCKSDMSYMVSALTAANYASLIASSINANKELCESICLAFHVGYPALGYFGISALKENLESEKYDFEIFTNSLKIITDIEKLCPEFNGLNLSLDIIEAIVKQALKNKSTDFDVINSVVEGVDICYEQNNSLEGQIACIAFRINSLLQKICILLESGVISYENLSQIPLLGDVIQTIEAKRYKNFYENLYDNFITISSNVMIANIVKQTKNNFVDFGINSFDDVMSQEKNVVSFSDAMEKEVNVIKIFVEDVLRKNDLVQMQKYTVYKAINAIFSFFIDNPGCMPSKWIENNSKNNQRRNIALSVKNYISSLTDQEAMELFYKIK